MAVKTAFPMGILSRNEVRGDGRDPHRDIGGRCRKTAFRGARRLCLMLLAGLRFRPGFHSCHADAGDSEVDGSDPVPFEWA